MSSKANILRNSDIQNYFRLTYSSRPKVDVDTHIDQTKNLTQYIVNEKSRDKISILTLSLCTFYSFATCVALHKRTFPLHKSKRFQC